MLQDELLDAAAGLVRPGGVLVYSTCSIERDEDHERVEAFLVRHPEYKSAPLGEGLPAQVLCEEGWVATLPHEHSIDGAFAARLVRLG